MSKPLVSVCIPAYNNEAYISETIDSILNQTYENLELIIVDDCSKDSTLSILREYEQKDSRVKVYTNENNLGMAGNWNRALELTTGKYIRLMCADDLLLPECISREVEIFEQQPTVVLVESDSALVDLAGNRKRTSYNRYPVNGLISGRTVFRKGLFVQDYFGAPQANLIRRSAYEAAGGIDPDFTYIVDYDFYGRIAKQGDLYIVHEFWSLFRVRHESNTGQVMRAGTKEHKKYVSEHRYLLEKNKEDLRLNGFDIFMSMLIRRLRCFAAGVYLMLFVRK